MRSTTPNLWLECFGICLVRPSTTDVGMRLRCEYPERYKRATSAATVRKSPKSALTGGFICATLPDKSSKIFVPVSCCTAPMCCMTAVVVDSNWSNESMFNFSKAPMNDFRDNNVLTKTEY